MIITLCASTSFYDHLGKVADELEGLGHQVFRPKTSLPDEEQRENDDSSEYGSWHKNLIDTHFGKIQKSDAVLIINDTKHGTTGYIGANTLMEITVAYYLKKKVFILNEVGSANPVYDEVTAIGALILDGDVGNIAKSQRKK